MFTKRSFRLVLTGVALGVAVTTGVQADLIFSDTFTTTSTGINDDLAARQSGSAATQLYTVQDTTIAQISANQLQIWVGTPRVWLDYDLGTAVAHQKYTIDATFNLSESNGYAMINLGQSLPAQWSSGDFIMDMYLTKGGNWYMESKFGGYGASGTITPAVSNIYQVQLQIDETSPSLASTCAVVIDGVTLGTGAFNYRIATPRYVGFEGSGGTVGFDAFSINQVPVPEPTTVVLATGLIGLLACGGRKRK